jgi:hypothetical protein
MSSEGDQPFTYSKEVICVQSTGDAIKVTPIHPHKPIPFWVPQEYVHDDSEIYKVGDEGKLVVKKSWADKQGWI